MIKTLTGLVAIAILCLVATVDPVFAIPSPELIVGSLSSLSQLGALGAAIFGGSAIFAGARSGGSRRLLWVTAGLAVTVALLLAALLTVLAWQADATRERLEANLLRPARQPGQQIADPGLKELSFAEQLRHPLGVSTTDASAWIAAMADDPNRHVIDARNDAEVEMGGIAAQRMTRLSDFRADDPAHKGRTFVFFCHNGNRSYETCEAARAKGIDCRFIIGGMEKWVVENRPMSGLQGRTLDQLRAIPDYPGKGRLLDTPEVKTLVAEKNAQFIDVRYPGDFERGHLPDAINITLRRMTADERRAALAAVPKRPVILPCYDRRSCFFADVMGLELTRAGHRVEGRYTVPHEYIVASPRPPHVEAWIVEQNKSYWQRAREAVGAALSWLTAKTGLPLALLLFALLSRLLVLPFALKSERDQITADATAGEVAVLKRKLRDDPIRLRRALMAHARRHNLTPVRNLAALLFLPLLALATLAAGDIAARHPQRFAWMPDLAAPDPTIALPLLFAVLLTFYCVAAFARTSRQRLLTTAICLPLFTILIVTLPAAAALYLVFSATLLIAQRAWTARVHRTALAALRAIKRDIETSWFGGAQRLDTALPATSIGNKAARLAALTARGFPVPSALVLDHPTLSRLLAAPPKQQRRLTRRMARGLGGTRFAVRSSAAGEDGAGASFAGVFDSELNVSRDDLAAAIRRVAASFSAARVTAYGVDGGHGNVIVQRMIDPAFAGVLFTRAPDAPAQMLVEVVDGTADDLASGRRSGTAFRFGRLTLQPIGEAPAVDLSALLRLAQRIAASAGKPQDIEWAYADKQFYILQARDIVADLTEPAEIAQAEQLLRATAVHASAPLEPTRVTFHASAMAELLPRPTTLSLDLLNALWAPGGSVDHAARALGLAYPATEEDGSRYARINGRLVANVHLETAHALHMTPRQRRRLTRSLPQRAAHIRIALDAIRADALRLSALDPARLSFDELKAEWRAAVDQFLTKTHPIAEEVNILAGLAAVDTDDSAAVSTLQPAWHRALLAAKALTKSERDDAFARIAGHRSNLDYELSHPRWAEIPGAIDAFAASLKPSPDSLPRAFIQPAAGNAGAASAGRTTSLWQRVTGRRSEAALTVSLADLAALKEDAKHEVLRDLARLRTLLLDLDRRLHLGGHIFELTLAEVGTLTPATAQAMQILARERRHGEQRLRLDAAPPPRVTARDVELLSTHDFGARMALHVPEAKLDGRCKGRGKRVSGRLEITGRAYVATQEQAETGLPLDGFRDGDILVTPLVHPDWLGIVLRAGGVVADTGSWLSHMAIVAREHGVSMIVGVPNAGQFRTGDRLRLTPDGKVMAEPDVVARLSLVGT